LIESLHAPFNIYIRRILTRECMAEMIILSKLFRFGIYCFNWSKYVPFIAL
jgi:hypothetical protein